MMTKYQELEDLMADLQDQNELYKPSSFWEQASLKIKAQIEEAGVENFRSLSLPLSFFVPTFGAPGNSFNAKMSQDLLDFFNSMYGEKKKPGMALENFLSGYAACLADYRVLLAGDDRSKQPILSDFSESDFGNPVEHFEFDGKYFSRSAMNYLLGLCLLKKHATEFPKITLEIGGGFGTLGEIMIKLGDENSKYIDVDIPPTIFVAQRYLEGALQGKELSSYKNTKGATELAISSLPQLTFLPSWQIELLSGKIDLFVNFISFQEMEPNIVKNYLANITRLQPKWILLRNMREGKQLKTSENLVGVEVPIYTDDYLSYLSGYDLVESSVVPFGFKTVDNFHSELLLLRAKA